MPCLLPIAIRDKRNGGTIPVPCGKCPDCRHRRVQNWVFRLQQEEKIHATSHFVTLTYAPETVPKTEKGFKTLHKKDLQDFFKRLRYYSGCKTIKYYAAGEYGSQTRRPHYHVILFDAQPEHVRKSWTKGHIDFGTVTSDSIAYTCKYICKPKTVPLHANDDRTPEFSLMSLRMGANYLTSQMVAYHRNNLASFVTLPGGYTQSLPRYYRDKIFDDPTRRHMARLLRPKIDALYDSAVQKAGSEYDYIRNKHEAVKVALEHYQQQKHNKRDKI